LKFFLYSLLYSILFFGCADKDAFSKFHLQEDQTKAIDNVVYSKITDTNTTIGISAVIYLNAVYPQQNNDKERFYVVLYLKNAVDTKDITFSLNNSKNATITQLNSKNQYSHLLKNDATWSKEFLVTFAKEKNKKLHFKINLLDSFESDAIFQKNL